MVVYKYALSTEDSLNEVTKNNAPGIHKIVRVVDKPGAKRPASTLMDKVANLINTTGVLKRTRETTT